MSTVQENPTLHEEATYCEIHPDRETSLRCNKCGRYMCVQCAVQTPVGYRCKECVRGLEDKFYNAGQSDYAIIFGVCVVLGLVGGFIANAIGFLLFVLLIAAPIGGIIAEAALRLTGRRRGRYSARVAAAGTALGALGPLLYVFIARGVLVPDLSLILFAALATAAVYGRFQMRL